MYINKIYLLIGKMCNFISPFCNCGKLKIVLYMCVCVAEQNDTAISNRIVYSLHMYCCFACVGYSQVFLKFLLDTQPFVEP